MTKIFKLYVFIICLVIGVLLNLTFPSGCREWGPWTNKFIIGSLSFDIFIVLRTIRSMIKKTFYSDCLLVSFMILSSFIWIPLLYKMFTAIYLIMMEGKVTQLGH